MERINGYSTYLGKGLSVEEEQLMRIIREIIPQKYEDSLIELSKLVSTYYENVSHINSKNIQQSQNARVAISLAEAKERLMQLASMDLTRDVLVEIEKIAIKNIEAIDGKLEKSYKEPQQAMSDNSVESQHYLDEIKNGVMALAKHMGMLDEHENQVQDITRLEITDRHIAEINEMNIPEESKEKIEKFIRVYFEFFISTYRELLQTSSEIVKAYQKHQLYEEGAHGIGDGLGYSDMYSSLCNQVVYDAFYTDIPTVLNHPNVNQEGYDTTILYMKVLSDIANGKELTEEQIEALKEASTNEVLYVYVPDGIEYVKSGVLNYSNEYLRKNDYTENKKL